MTTPRRFTLLIAALALAGLAAAPPAAHAFFCNPHDIEWDTWTYYSDATYTTIVGRCSNDCGTCECYGTQTIYVKVHSQPIC